MPKRKSAPKKSDNFFHPKHRPAHGMIIGALLILLKGVVSFFAVAGVIILLLSTVAYLLRLKSSK